MIYFFKIITRADCRGIAKTRRDGIATTDNAELCLSEEIQTVAWIYDYPPAEIPSTIAILMIKVIN